MLIMALTILMCTQEGTIVKCDVTEEPTGSYAMNPIVKLLIVEVAKSATYDLVKHAVLVQYKKQFPNKKMPSEVGLIKRSRLTIPAEE